jgi:hypothetical protein
VVGGPAVLEDPHADLTQLNGVSTIGPGDRYLHGWTSCS